MMQAPRWLEVLLEEKFFEECSLHRLDTKNEKNILCLDCCLAVCAHCLAPDHTAHRLIQIRRYVYHDVIRLEDVDNLINCSSIQSYVNNGAKVVFLNERPQARPFRTSGNVCLSCSRCLQDSFSFCSLCCKVTHLLKRDGRLSSELLGGSGESAGGLVEWFRKKRSSLTAARTASAPVCSPLLIPASSSSSSFVNRRKSCTPQRSPLY